MNKIRMIVAGIGASALLLAGCSNHDPLTEPTQEPDSSEAIVIGSQQYYSNEIIAELYAQSLEEAGETVERQYQIGQREVYLPELESGAIDVIPEYSGNLMQYLDKDASASDPDGIEQAVSDSLPEGLRVLPAAEATDQDSYVVTRAFADEHQLTSIGDLTKVGPVQLAANSEFETRPYGPTGAKEIYGVDVTVVPVEDSGGPLTVKALTEGNAQVADIYSSDPAIKAHDLVALDDPEGMILPQQVLPVVSDAVNDDAADAIARVNEKLTTEQLIELNRRSVDEQLKSKDIAEQWLHEQGIVG